MDGRLTEVSCLVFALLVGCSSSPSEETGVAAPADVAPEQSVEQCADELEGVIPPDFEPLPRAERSPRFSARAQVARRSVQR